MIISQLVPCLQCDTMQLTSLVLLGAIFASASAKVAVIKKCKNVSDDVCSVTEVRIEPCRKASECVLYQGSDVNMNFDFTPNFAATKMKTAVYWDNGVSDLPFSAMESNNACDYTGCPTQAGTSQTLNYNLHVDKKSMPKGSYLIKWKVWNEEDDSQVCCFETNIEIKKKKKN